MSKWWNIHIILIYMPAIVVQHIAMQRRAKAPDHLAKDLHSVLLWFAHWTVCALGAALLASVKISRSNRSGVRMQSSLCMSVVYLFRFFLVFTFVAIEIFNFICFWFEIEFYISFCSLLFRSSSCYRSVSVFIFYILNPDCFFVQNETKYAKFSCYVYFVIKRQVYCEHKNFLWIHLKTLLVIQFVQSKIRFVRFFSFFIPLSLPSVLIWFISVL